MPSCHPQGADIEFAVHTEIRLKLPWNLPWQRGGDCGEFYCHRYRIL